jgi:UDPglucose--hexose-1-phosphate uridylyltransferase
MTIAFKKISRETSYLDPNKGFGLTRIDFEIRFDPLTHATGRIVTADASKPDPPDLEALIERSLQIGCPFCQGAMEMKTAKFPPDVIPDGRIQKGKAILLPNIIPFATHAAICLFSDDHFIPLDGFTPELISDAFLACQDFFQRVASRNSEVAYFSINWNYMPPAGSSLIHPHLQPIAGETPTNTQNELIRASHEYVTQHITHYWRDLVEKEKDVGERYLGKMGRVVWIAPFVPTGLYPDTMAVFWDCPDLRKLGEQDLFDFSCGLVKVFGFYHSLGIYSFNLSLFSGPAGDSTVWVHSRITPRSCPRPIGNSDITYFGMLHKEPISVMKPEDMASRLRPLFSS